MNKFFFLILSSLCFNSMSAASTKPPQLVKVFLKKFCNQMGNCKKWSFSTPQMTTDWGCCKILNDKIIVTIGDKTEEWLVPGGPWTVEYTTENEEINLIKTKDKMSSLDKIRDSVRPKRFKSSSHKPLSSGSVKQEIPDWQQQISKNLRDLDNQKRDIGCPKRNINNQREISVIDNKYFLENSFIKEIEDLFSLTVEDAQAKIVSIIASKQQDTETLIRLKKALNSRILLEKENKKKHLTNITVSLFGSLLSGGAGYYFGSKYLSRRNSINKIYDYFSSHGVSVEGEYKNSFCNTIHYEMHLSSSKENLSKVDPSKLNELVKLRNLQEDKVEPLIVGSGLILAFFGSACSGIKDRYRCRNRVAILLEAEKELYKRYIISSYKISSNKN